MCPAVNQTFSLNFETYGMLEDLHAETQVNRSRLIRAFIKHFSKDRFALQELIKSENLSKELEPIKITNAGGK